MHLNQTLRRSLPFTAELDAEGSKKAAESVPWGSIDLTTGNVDIQKMLKKTDAFDSSVPGVTQMPGGQTAGYARWEAFKKNGLSQYAARRNNAMLRQASPPLLRFCMRCLFSRRAAVHSTGKFFRCIRWIHKKGFVSFVKSDFEHIESERNCWTSELSKSASSLWPAGLA